MSNRYPTKRRNGPTGLYFGVSCYRRPTIGASPTTFHTVSEGIFSEVDGKRAAKRRPDPAGECDAVVGREGIKGVLSEQGGSDGTDGQPDGNRSPGVVHRGSDREGGRASPVGVGRERRSLGLGQGVRRRRSGERQPRDAPDELPVVLDDQD